MTEENGSIPAAPAAPVPPEAPAAPAAPVAPVAPAPAAPVAPAPVPPAAPVAGAMPQQPPMGAPMPPVPPVPPMPPVPPVPPTAAQNIPGMPLFALTGGQKFGWLLVGFLMGPVGILLAWLTNTHNFPKAKSDAITFSIIGFVLEFVGIFLLFGVTMCSTMAMFAGIDSMYY